MVLSWLLRYKLECVVNIQVAQFLFGDGFAVSGGDQWRVRRKAVNPALHKAYLNTMIDRVFAPSALHLAEKLQVITALFIRAVNIYIRTYESVYDTHVYTHVCINIYIYTHVHICINP